MNSKNSRLINSLRKLLLGNNIQIEMEQTKAVFRNKPFILLKGIILLLIFILTTSLVRAQYSLGSTGQLMIPTAEMQETGTFIGGANYLPEQVTPSVFSFPTMNYFVDMTLFSFIEFTYRMTLLKMTTATGRTGYHNQDRSNTIRIRPLKESRYFPAVHAVHFNDFWYIIVHGVEFKPVFPALGDRAFQRFPDAARPQNNLVAASPKI